MIGFRETSSHRQIRPWYCEKPPEKAKPILRRGLILFILLQTPRQLEIFPCFCTQARETIRTLVHKHDTIVTIKLKYRSIEVGYFLQAYRKNREIILNSQLSTISTDLDIQWG